MLIKRYLEDIITHDALVKKKMAFISGPRQVGKSTLANALIEHPENYFLYDDEDFRRLWIKSPEGAISKRLSGPIILDEIHKDRRWKSKLKGIYDKNKSNLQIIVTGSSRLDIYRKGGDSLLGRYLPYRLYPLSVAESPSSKKYQSIFTKSAVHYPWKDLLVLGGFPEPFLAGRENEALRWSRLRLDQLIFEDSRDLRNINDINAFRVLTDLLPSRVGSLLSINSLREDVGKAYATVRDWVQILEALYFGFFIRPYSTKLSRTLKAEPKFFLYDILRIPKESMAQRIENLAALHLLKACHYWTDSAQGEFELKFVRNKDCREIDFLIIKNNKPWMAIECKSNNKTINQNLKFYSKILNPKYSIQLVSIDGYDKYFVQDKIRIVNYEKFFSELI